MATLHLADMGADVVKIEDTEAGDYSRAMGHVRGVPPMSDVFRLVNRNKRAMRLDLKQAQGREVFLRLAKGADVVVEGFRPGVMAKLGVGYEALAAVNPGLVYFSNTEGHRPAARACSAAGSPATTSTARATAAGWRWGRSSENSGKRCAIYSGAPN